MKPKFLLLAGALALSAGFTALPASAQSYNGPVVRYAPPPPRYEAAPPHRHHHFWVQGHWRWNGYRYVWVRGHWERERIGYRYEAPRWVQGPNGHWHYREYRWER
jgi:hypothetical protein